MIQSYIALGSNIGNASANVQQAMAELSKIGKLGVCSSLYLTKPWGYLDQSDFINAVVSIETNTSAHELLKQVQDIEEKMGRERLVHWGPRTIDIDILTYGTSEINESDLKIPHPHMLERAFVLGPLSEIDNSYLAAFMNLSNDLRQEIQRLDDNFDCSVKPNNSPPLIKEERK